MAAARQLKSGRWRIYDGPDLEPIRDPENGAIVTFDAFETARGWWARWHPGEPALEQAPRCARCGGYFEPGVVPTVYAGRVFHATHTPQAIAFQRRA